MYTIMSSGIVFKKKIIKSHWTKKRSYDFWQRRWARGARCSSHCHYMFERSLIRLICNSERVGAVLCRYHHMPTDNFTRNTTSNHMLHFRVATLCLLHDIMSLPHFALPILNTLIVICANIATDTDFAVMLETCRRCKLPNISLENKTLILKYASYSNQPMGLKISYS